MATGTQTQTQTVAAETAVRPFRVEFCLPSVHDIVHSLGLILVSGVQLQGGDVRPFSLAGRFP